MRIKKETLETIHPSFIWSSYPEARGCAGGHPSCLRVVSGVHAELDQIRTQKVSSRWQQYLTNTLLYTHHIPICLFWISNVALQPKNFAHHFACSFMSAMKDTKHFEPCGAVGHHLLVNRSIEASLQNEQEWRIVSRKLTHAHTKSIIPGLPKWRWDWALALCSPQTTRCLGTRGPSGGNCTCQTHACAPACTGNPSTSPPPQLHGNERAERSGGEKKAREMPAFATPPPQKKYSTYKDLIYYLYIIYLLSDIFKQYLKLHMTMLWPWCHCHRRTHKKKSIANGIEILWQSHIGQPDKKRIMWPHHKEHLYSQARQIVQFTWWATFWSPNRPD